MKIEEINDEKILITNILNIFIKSFNHEKNQNINFYKNKKKEINQKYKLNMKNDKVNNNQNIPLLNSFNNDAFYSNIYDSSFPKNSKISTNHSSNFSFLNKTDKISSNINITSRRHSQIFNQDKNMSFLKNNYQFKSNDCRVKTNKNVGEVNCNQNNNNNNNLKNFIKNQNLETFAKQANNLLKNQNVRNIKLDDCLEEREFQKESDSNINDSNFNSSILKYSKNSISKMGGKNILSINKNSFSKQRWNIQNADNTINTNNSLIFNHSVSLNENNENTNFSTCTNFNHNNNSDFGNTFINNLGNKRYIMKDSSNNTMPPRNNFNEKLSQESIQEEDHDKIKLTQILKSKNERTFAENLQKFQEQKSPTNNDFISRFSKSYTNFFKSNENRQKNTNFSNTFMNKLKEIKNTYYERNSSSRKKINNNCNFFDKKAESLNSENFKKFKNLSPTGYFGSQDLNMNETFTKEKFNKNKNEYLFNTSNIPTLDFSNKESRTFSGEFYRSNNTNKKGTEINLKSKDAQKNFSGFDLRILNSIQNKITNISSSKQTNIDTIKAIQKNLYNKSKTLKIQQKNELGSNNVSPSQEKRTIFTKKNNLEIIYKQVFPKQNEIKLNFEEPENADQSFFRNEILNRNLIASPKSNNIEKQGSNVVNNKKNRNESLTREEKERLDNYFLTKLEDKFKFSKTSNEGGFYNPILKSSNFDTFRKLNENKNSDKNEDVKEYENQDIKQENNIVLPKNYSTSYNTNSSKNENPIDLRNSIDSLKRIKKPYLNYNHPRTGKTISTSKIKDNTNINEKKNDNTNAQNINKLLNKDQNFNIKRNFSSGDVFKKNNINTIKNISSNLPVNKIKTSQPLINRSVTFKEPEVGFRDNKSSPNFSGKSENFIRRGKTTGDIKLKNNLNDDTNFPIIENNDNENIGMHKKTQNQIIREAMSTSNRRNHTADTIKRNVSSICNHQIYINNQLLKPMITKDIKNKDFKLFKKYFKSSDDGILMQVYDNFYKSLKLDENKKKDIKIVKKSSEPDKKESNLAKIPNSKEFMDKNNNNKHKLEIIEENEKEEKLNDFPRKGKKKKTKSHKKALVEEESLAKLVIGKEKIQAISKPDDTSILTNDNKFSLNLKNLQNVNSSNFISPKISKTINDIFENHSNNKMNRESSERRNDILQKNESFNKKRGSNLINKNLFNEDTQRKFSIISIVGSNTNTSNLEIPISNNNINSIYKKVIINELINNNIDDNNKIKINNIRDFIGDNNKKNSLILSPGSLKRKAMITSLKANEKARKNHSFIDSTNNNYHRFSIIKGSNSNVNYASDSNKKLSKIKKSNIYFKNINLNSPNNTDINLKNKFKKKFHSTHKLYSYNSKNDSNYEFIRNFNLSLEKDRLQQKNLLFSFPNLTEPNYSEEIVFFKTQINPQLNKSFDFNMNISIESGAPPSNIFVNNFNNLNKNVDKNKNENFYFYEKENFDSSRDNSFISINYKDRKSSRSNGSNNNLKNKEREIFDKINLNEQKLKKINQKLKMISPEEKKYLKIIDMGNSDQLKKDFLGSLPDFVKYKRETQFLKYDLMTRIDNGLFYKENLRRSFMQKLIPGNYMNVDTESFKIEVLHPRFIKHKFAKIMPAFAPGKPIVKNSDQSTKEYLLYYEKKRIPKVFQEKDAFSVMNIFK